MSKPDIHLVDADHEIELQFRLVMRRLAGCMRALVNHTPDSVPPAAASITETFPIPARRSANAKAEPDCPPPTTTTL
jgi:hypothetical protein